MTTWNDGFLLPIITVLFVCVTGIPACSQTHVLSKSSDSSYAQVRIQIVDSLTSRPTPVRVRITKNDNRVVKILPENAIAVMYGLWDHADGYGFQPDSAFYVDGFFELLLEPGRYTITLSKGVEYLNQQHAFILTSGSALDTTFRMARWINMPLKGWYSADNHIHIRRSPREDQLLMKWIQAEDIHIGVLLKMGDFWATYYAQYGWGEQGVYQDGNYLLTSGQEDPRTPELGHAIGFGASAYVRDATSYYYYDKVFDRLHQLGGITGYAHQAKSFHGYRGLMLDGLRRKVDVLELLQFCISEDPLHTQHYYHLLDLGYAVTAIAGSDFPWCGNDHSNGPPEKNARIGNVRFYSFLESPLSYSSWKNAIKKGHTFVTSGPMLSFTVNDKLPGDTLFLKNGSAIQIKATAFGHSRQVPLDRLEVLVHGKTVTTISAKDPKQSTAQLSIDMQFDITEGCWIAVKCYAGTGQVAHATPVYVSVDGSGFHNKATINKYLDLAEQHLRELEKNLRKNDNNPEYQSWRYRKGIKKRIIDTRNVIMQLRRKKEQ
ncbi:MAG TPA: CehA/McbA family metallohydrolase [Ohtaekwangia sp.]|nr:CehA/McbA family metallohydrolase [Ohtaekwangia sp.]